LSDAFFIQNGLKHGEALLFNALSGRSRKTDRGLISTRHIIFFSLLIKLIYCVWRRISSRKKRQSICCKEVGTDVKAGNYIYVHVSSQTTGRNFNIKVANKLLGNAADFMCLSRTVIDKALIHEEIKSILNSGNFCCRIF
jgi:hypothetical protein